MRTGKTIVFVEVRYRTSQRYGGALASVTAAKRQRMIVTASAYLESRPDLRRRPCRFDVVGVSGCLASPRFEWVEAAFTV